MAKSNSSLSAITDFIRRNPRTAAIAAFNVGLYAASLTRRGVRRGELAELPAKLVDLVPSMRDLMSLLHIQEEPANPRRRRSQPRRAGTRKAAKRRARGTGNGGAS